MGLLEVLGLAAPRDAGLRVAEGRPINRDAVQQSGRDQSKEYVRALDAFEASLNALSHPQALAIRAKLMAEVADRSKEDARTGALDRAIERLKAGSAKLTALVSSTNSATTSDAKRPPGVVEPSEKLRPTNKTDGVHTLLIWQDAWAKVDARLFALKRALLADEDRDFARLAETRLFDVGKQENEALMQALSQFQKAEAQGKPVAAKQVLAAALVYKDLLTRSRLVDMLDDNPFDVDIGLRQTLGGALSELIGSIC